jgi:Rieske Fe-S protein
MPDNTNLNQQGTILQEIQASKPKNWKLITLIVFVVGSAIVAGAVSGFFFWQTQLQKSTSTSDQKNASNQQKPPEPEQDVKTFRDQAEGVIEKNEGTNQYGQGTHKLARSGGQSQTAYLVSSVVDLDQYLGKNVVVYGETFSSTQVGWLMDVGKVETKD